LEEKQIMVFRKVATLVAGAAILFAACSSSGSSPAASAGGAASGAASGGGAAGCKVGVSWNNYKEERWAKWDEPAIKAAVEAAGGTYIANDAKSSAATQATNIDQLISQGAKVLIVLAQDTTAIKPAVASASSQGIPVIGYDRLIEDPKALYVTFDNKGVGKMQAEALLKAVPKGNYAIIKGNSADGNSDFLRSGMTEAGIPKDMASSAGSATPIVGETYTDNWDAKKAQTEMEQILTQSNNNVQAVLSENDGMAGGVIAALKAQGLNGKVAVSGQDGDEAALNNVALGNQTVDVWKDARELGKAAGEAAVQMCAGTTVDKITGTAPFTTPGGNTVSSIIIAPHPITTDTLQTVVDAGWITKEKLCAGVVAATAPTACK
jgi:D-xylose transport system substrate-binding protein